LEGALPVQPVFETAVAVENEVSIQVEREVVRDHTPVSTQGSAERILSVTWLPEPRRSKKMK
jgi:hypothetical protein